MPSFAFSAQTRIVSSCFLCASLLAACGPSAPVTRAPLARRPEPVSPEPERDLLPPLDVLQRLRGSEGERRACFDASDRASDGFVKLAWGVSTEGRVDGVAVEGSSVHDETIEQCLAAEIQKLDFGPRSAPSRARWTFVHRLPKMPGADDEFGAKAKRKRKQKKRAGDEEEVTGISIEEASPGTLELHRIEDIVHAGFPLFAYCYRAGLERDPSLGGLVQLRFVIDEEGSVMGVMDSGSEFRDTSALDCMAEGIFALNFPAPVGGDVRVQYRIVFESG